VVYLTTWSQHCHKAAQLLRAPDLHRAKCLPYQPSEDVGQQQTKEDEKDEVARTRKKAARMAAIKKNRPFCLEQPLKEVKFTVDVGSMPYNTTREGDAAAGRLVYSSPSASSQRSLLRETGHYSQV